MRAWSRVAIHSLFLGIVQCRTIRESHALDVIAPHASAFLASTDCGCVRNGCSCAAAISFMRCMKDACNSHQCKCLHATGEHHFQKSCSWMANDCEELDLACEANKTTCGDMTVTWDPDLANYMDNEEYEAKISMHLSHTHQLFTLAVVLFVIIMCLILALAETGNVFIVKNAYATLDLVVITFLALSWYFILMHFLSIVFGSDADGAKTAVHLSIGVVLLSVSTSVSWSIRNSTNRLLMFRAVFTPIVMWCFVGILSSMQHHVQGSRFKVFLAIIALITFFITLTLVWYALGARFLERGWDDETVNKAAGASIAAGFVHWLHMLVSDDYHSLEDPQAISFKDTMMCNLLGLLFFIIAVASTPVITILKEHHKGQYWTERIIGTSGHLLHFMPKYSIVLSLHQLISAVTGLHHASVETSLIMAALCTFVAVAQIILCAFVPLLQRRKDLSAELVGISGFIIGTTWAQLLNHCISLMQEGNMHPFHMKVAITSFLTAVILPVYWFYLKPLIIAKTK